MFGFFLREGPVRSFDEARTSDTDLFRRFHRAALERGVFFAPSPFEAGFLSTVHGDEEIQFTIDVAREAARLSVEA
jgi:glutamate-1-semialdehyde 2,1-aminomutase